jgi:hypothetical protein
MKHVPTLRRYWFPASQGLGIGVTAPDAGTAWFAAKAALPRLPPGATLSGQYIEDIDPSSLDLGPALPAQSTAPGVWFPPGHPQPVQIRVARTPSDALAGFVRISDDGAAHELTQQEAEYLATAFDATDGARPYVKKHYDSQTPDGRLLGFLSRSELPAHVTVRSSPERRI